MAEHISGHKVLSHSTLMAMPKRDLITEIRILEHNWKSALETNEQQYQNTKDWQPVVYGNWEWYEEWSPSSTDAPAECAEAGWRCCNCKTPLEEVVGGYWDDPDESPNIKYCPECGSKNYVEDE